MRESCSRLLAQPEPLPEHQIARRAGQTAHQRKAARVARKWVLGTGAAAARKKPGGCGEILDCAATVKAWDCRPNSTRVSQPDWVAARSVAATADVSSWRVAAVIAIKPENRRSA